MAATPTASVSDVKRRVPLLPTEAGKLDELVTHLSAIEPISEVHVDAQGRLRIRYDASCMSLRDIERVLDEAGIGRPATLGWRIKSAWYRFVDDNARSNALSSGGACCSRPPSPLGISSDKERGG